MSAQHWLRCAAALAVTFSVAATAQQTRIYNTVKTKLEAGQQVVGGTVTVADPNIYCAMANSGYDFLWIEMQHSPLTYQEVARMIWACRDAPAIPFVRVPDATAGDLQKATDIGALGIIIPLVDTVEKISDAVRYAKFPPEGVRSLGGGQHRGLWGNDYRATANDNIVIVAMIESPAGVALADDIAAVEGVDVVMAASTDLGSFSGLSQGTPEYEAMVTTIHDATLGAGLKLGGPQAWRDRAGFSFFQGPSDTALLGMGVAASLQADATGVAPTEGAEDD
ncbi:HpcH/HpaI aldolase family protein [Candidatus Rariloculus sp.]|uniref:HpcH/HpaI aldolase family protein n=1 Tax=Candidatus Rariloculus sp. TaxID=3101265 RepID=UPI003D0E05C4